MQLILVDGVVPFERIRDSVGNPTICFAPEIQVKCLEEDIGNIFSVSTGENSSMKLIMQPVPENGAYEIMFYSTNKDSDIIANVQRNFPGKLMINLEVKTTTPGVLLDSEKTNKEKEKGTTDFNYCCLSADMLLAPGQTFCKAISPYIKTVDLGELSNKNSFHMKITALIYDPNAHHLKRTTKKILHDGLASDVTIEAENGVTIKTHKCFLIASSSVLQRMFQNEMEEARNGRIDMTDMSEAGVRAFLRFLYQGDIIGMDESLDTAFDVLYAAHKYNVQALESMMKAYMMERNEEDFSAQQLLKIYSFLRRIDADTASVPLKDKLLKLMTMKFAELKELPEFKEIFQKCPNDAFEMCSSLVMAKPQTLTLVYVDVGSHQTAQLNWIPVSHANHPQQ